MKYTIISDASDAVISEYSQRRKNIVFYNDVLLIAA